MLISLLALKRINSLKVLSYWNLNLHCSSAILSFSGLKVLSYWNLNYINNRPPLNFDFLKVLSYWNLNISAVTVILPTAFFLKYYHIGI